MLRNFAGVSSEQLLERMIELSLYAEEKLKARWPSGEPDSVAGLMPASQAVSGSSR